MLRRSVREVRCVSFTLAWLLLAFPVAPARIGLLQPADARSQTPQAPQVGRKDPNNILRRVAAIIRERVRPESAIVIKPVYRVDTGAKTLLYTPAWVRANRLGLREDDPYQFLFQAEIRIQSLEKCFRDNAQ